MSRFIRFVSQNILSDSDQNSRLVNILRKLPGDFRTQLPTSQCVPMSSTATRHGETSTKSGRIFLINVPEGARRTCDFTAYFYCFGPTKYVNLRNYQEIK